MWIIRSLLRYSYPNVEFTYTQMYRIYLRCHTKRCVGGITSALRKEGNVLFNDAPNFLRLYDVRHMVKDHSEETRCRHIAYSFRLAARVLLYAPSHRRESTYHGLCYTSRGALAGKRVHLHECRTAECARTHPPATKW